jgi:hypothetical protein
MAEQILFTKVNSPSPILRLTFFADSPLRIPRMDFSAAWATGIWTDRYGKSPRRNPWGSFNRINISDGNSREIVPGKKHYKTKKSMRIIAESVFDPIISKSPRETSHFHTLGTANCPAWRGRTMRSPSEWTSAIGLNQLFVSWTERPEISCTFHETFPD